MNNKINNKKKSSGDIEILIILSLSFSALVYYLFDIKSVYYRLALILVITTSFYVFYETIKKADIHSNNGKGKSREIKFKLESK
jgi:hypothetical protein